MKAMGFRNGRVACLLLAESLIVCGIGTAVGFAASTILFAKAQVTMFGLSMPWGVLVEGMAPACAVACLTTTLPAWR